MAQRMIHYAIAKKLTETGYIKDEYRFCLGSIIPDSNDRTGEEYNRVHYILKEGTKKTFDFTRFFKENKKLVLENDMYLGYYIHLITDVIYRNFLYDVKGLRNRRQEENFTEKLHSDYHNLNYIVKTEYSLEKLVVDTQDVPKEFGLSKIDELQDRLDEEFKDEHVSDLNYITSDILKEFMEYILPILKTEVKNIKEKEKSMLNSKDYLY